MTATNGGGRLVKKQQCTVSEERNGTIYRCAKDEGHESSPGNEEHEVYAPEYAAIDWRMMFDLSRPLLEWIAANPQLAGRERNEQARRILIRAYTASSKRPGLVKSKAVNPG